MTQEKPNPGGNDFWEQALKEIDTSGLHGIPPLQDRIVTEAGTPVQNEFFTILRSIYRPLEEYIVEQTARLTSATQIPGIQIETQKSRLRTKGKLFRFRIRSQDESPHEEGLLKAIKSRNGWQCTEYQEGDQIYRLDESGTIVGLRIDIERRNFSFRGEALEKFFGHKTYGSSNIGIIDFSFPTADRMEFSGSSIHNSTRKKGTTYENIEFKRSIGTNGELVDERGSKKLEESDEAIRWALVNSELARKLFASKMESRTKND